jgi:hypothetical protein
MRIRDVLEKRRRILVVADVGALLVLGFGLYLSARIGERWLRYFGAAIFFLAIWFSSYWLRCPRCRRSTGLARVSTRKAVRPFEAGELCPYCGVSWEEPWDIGGVTPNNRWRGP